jgi:hypothetical protein
MEKQKDQKDALNKPMPYPGIDLRLGIYPAK